jgi:putative transposase
LSEISISNIQRRNRRIYEGTGDSIVQTKRRVEVLELNVQPDHVHLVVSIPPKYAVSEFMGYLKGKQALRLFQQYESLGRRYWGRHLWARGYCVSTIGLDEEKIRKYVKWQEKQEKQAEIVQGKLFE